MDKIPKEGRWCQLTSIKFCALFWISWPLKLGTTGCPKTSVLNYHSRAHTTIWWCRTWFDSTWSSSEWYSLAQPVSALHVQIKDDLTYLSTKFKGKKPVLHCNKYFMYIPWFRQKWRHILSQNTQIGFSSLCKKYRMENIHFVNTTKVWQSNYIKLSCIPLPTILTSWTYNY